MLGVGRYYDSFDWFKFKTARKNKGIIKIFSRQYRVCSKLLSEWFKRPMRIFLLALHMRQIPQSEWSLKETYYLLLHTKQFE